VLSGSSDLLVSFFFDILKLVDLGTYLSRYDDRRRRKIHLVVGEKLAAFCTSWAILTLACAESFLILNSEAEPLQGVNHVKSVPRSFRVL